MAGKGVGSVSFVILTASQRDLLLPGIILLLTSVLVSS